jgi:hypothetical protein
MVRTVERVAVVVAALVGLTGCGGGGGSSDPMPTAEVEGGSSPETVVEAFLAAAQEAVRSRAAGEFTVADRSYDKMAAVFGTEQGSITRSFSVQEVRSRMIVLSACLRPLSYRVISSPDPGAWSSKQTTVSIDLMRDEGTTTLAFTAVLGRSDRWFIERIDLSDFSC